MMRYSKTLLTTEGNEGSHPSEDDLEEFVFGRLDGDALDQVDEHLLGCEACRRRLAETESFIASTRAAARKMLGAPQPQPKPRRFSAPALAWAGAFGLLLVAGYMTVSPRLRAPQELTLVAERGGPSSPAESGRPLKLLLHVPGDRRSDIRWLEIVDSQGARLHAAAVSVKSIGPGPSGQTFPAVEHQTPPLSPGQAWVRLYAVTSPTAEATPIAEYNLVVR